MKNAILILALFGQSLAQAKDFTKTCVDLKSCVQAVSELTGDQYFFDTKESLQTSGTLQTAKPVEMTAENADYLLSLFLFNNRVNRVPSGPKSYLIMRDNDAKGENLPRYTATFEKDPEDFPVNWFLVTVTYRAKHAESVKYMENIVRTYANMGSRIYGAEQTGTLLITTYAMEMPHLLKIMRDYDVAISPALIQKWKVEAESRRKEQARFDLMKEKNEKKTPTVRATPVPTLSH